MCLSPACHGGIHVAVTPATPLELCNGRLTLDVAQGRQQNTSPQLSQKKSQELGGKSAMIVFEDVDIDKAVEWAMVRIPQRLARVLMHSSGFQSRADPP